MSNLFRDALEQPTHCDTAPSSCRNGAGCTHPATCSYRGAPAPPAPRPPDQAPPTIHPSTDAEDRQP